MSIIDIVINIFEVLPKDIARMNQDTLIQAPLITGFFYFISRWFRAYILRIGLFLFGAFILLNVFQGQSFLNRFDFYAGLGLLLPHIEMVELSILILKERMQFLYEKMVALFFTLVSPFVWLFDVSRNILGFFKAKKEEKNNRNSYEQYYKDFQEEQKEEQSYSQSDFRKRQEEEYRKEQARRDEQYKREKEKEEKQQQKHSYGYTDEKREDERKAYQRKVDEKEKEKEASKHPRWDNADEYIVLEVDKNATFEQIKKKYRQLVRIYHPDYTLTKKEEYQVILQKINNAYEKLERKYSKN